MKKRTKWLGIIFALLIVIPAFAAHQVYSSTVSEKVEFSSAVSSKVEGKFMALTAQLLKQKDYEMFEVLEVSMNEHLELLHSLDNRSVQPDSATEFVGSYDSLTADLSGKEILNWLETVDPHSVKIRAPVEDSVWVTFWAIAIVVVIFMFFVALKWMGNEVHEVKWMAFVIIPSLSYAAQYYYLVR